jgi:hypothetical protein
MGMNHHCSCTVDNGLDRAFGAAIHVFGSNAGVGIRLVLGEEVVLEFVGGEDAVIGVIGFDRNAMFGTFLFKEFLAFQGVGGAEGFLVVAKDETGCVVIEDGATNIFVAFTLFTSSFVSASTDGALILVKRDTLTGLEFIARENTLS